MCIGVVCVVVWKGNCDIVYCMCVICCVSLYIGWICCVVVSNVEFVKFYCGYWVCDLGLCVCWFNFLNCFLWNFVCVVMDVWCLMGYLFVLVCIVCWCSLIYWMEFVDECIVVCDFGCYLGCVFFVYVYGCVGIWCCFVDCIVCCDCGCVVVFGVVWCVSVVWILCVCCVVVCCWYCEFGVVILFVDLCGFVCDGWYWFDFECNDFVVDCDCCVCVVVCVVDEIVGDWFCVWFCWGCCVCWFGVWYWYVWCVECDCCCDVCDVVVWVCGVLFEV